MSTQQRGPRRVALYSHDTQGLGHIRRNIAIAAALARAGEVDILLLTGSPEATTLPLPPRTDVVTLPTVAKDADGRYAARILHSSLRRVSATRSAIIDGALRGFDPDLLIVDKAAAGVDGELLPALGRLKSEGRTRTVLGLREILDSDDVVDREWRRDRTVELVRSCYDQVWVYGDPTVHDLTAAHRQVAAVADQVVHTGYLAAERNSGLRTRVRAVERIRPPEQPYLLCLVGGGQDGRELAEVFARSEMPAGHLGVILTGPYLPDRALAGLRELAVERPWLRIVDHTPDSVEFIAGAAGVVSMAGYNSVCELLAAGRPTLLVPRVTPRLEQWIRADRLSALGLVETVDPVELAPQRLTDWAARVPQLHTGADPVAAVDLQGLARIPELAAALAGEVSHAA